MKNFVTVCKTLYLGWNFCAELKDKREVQQCIAQFRMSMCSRNKLNMPMEYGICGPESHSIPVIGGWENI